LEKLRTEIDGAEISSPISNAEAKQLPYLQAVIQEGIRMLPPISGLSTKVVPAGGDIICGVQVPEGTWVGINVYGCI
jgi:cytochrome P450